MRDDVRDILDVYYIKRDMCISLIIGLVLSAGLAWLCGYDFKRDMTVLLIFVGWLVFAAVGFLLSRLWAEFLEEKMKARH